MLVCLLSQQAADDPVLPDSRQETPVAGSPLVPSTGKTVTTPRGTFQNPSVSSGIAS